MSELSPAFRQLLERCATCNGPMPCALHDAALREALLRPPEPEGLPWEKLERTDLLDDRLPIDSLCRLPDGAILVGGMTGNVTRYTPGDPTPEILGEYSNGRNINTMLPLPDGTILVGGGGGKLLRFTPGDPAPEVLGGDRRYGGHIYNLFSLPDGTVLVCGASGYSTLTPWNSNDPILGKYIGRGIESLLSCTDGTFLVGAGSTGELFRRNPGSPDPEVLGVYGNHIQALLHLPDGAVLVGGFGGNLSRFTPGSTTPEILGNYGNTIFDLLYLQDGTVLAGGEGGNLTRFIPGNPNPEVLGNYGGRIKQILPLSETSFLVGGSSGKLARYAIPEDVLRARRERKLDVSTVPPMPEA